MPSASELLPKQGINHPYTGQSVVVDRIKVIKGGVRVYFKGYGVSGWFTLPPETNIELAPERSQRDSTRGSGSGSKGSS